MRSGGGKGEARQDKNGEAYIEVRLFLVVGGSPAEFCHRLGDHLCSCEGRRFVESGRQAGRQSIVRQADSQSGIWFIAQGGGTFSPRRTGYLQLLMFTITAIFLTFLVFFFAPSSLAVALLMS